MNNTPSTTNHPLPQDRRYKEISYELTYLQSEDKAIQIRIEGQMLEFISIVRESGAGFKAVYENSGRHDNNPLTGQPNPAGFDQYIGQLLDLYQESNERNWTYAKRRLKDFICSID